MDNRSRIRMKLNDISRWFGQQPGVRNVDLDISPGDSVGFVGPNGSGKTTLLKLISGHYPPTTGQIHRYLDEEPQESLDAHIGFAGHDLMLYEQLSTRENLTFFSELYSNTDAGDRIRNLLETMRLSDRAEDPVSALSSGMKKKLSICRALVHEPNLLLLDEPFRGIDATSTEQTRTLLNAFQSEGGTLLLSSHDLQHVNALCQRVVVLVDSEPRHKEHIDGQKFNEFQTTYRNIASGS